MIASSRYDPVNGLSGLLNLNSVYKSATDWERQDGRIYYRNANTKLCRIAKEWDLPPEPVAGAFAALSPNNDENGNYIDLESCLSAHRMGNRFPKVRTYGANRSKAMDILRSRRVMDILGGNKVRNFYLNLIEPNDPFPVTVDGHMVSVWNGKRLLLARRRKRNETAIIINDLHYNRIANDIRTVASDYGMIPCQLQATLWLAWKRMNKIRYDPQLKLDF